LAAVKTTVSTAPSSMPRSVSSGRSVSVGDAFDHRLYSKSVESKNIAQIFSRAIRLYRRDRAKRTGLAR